MKNTKYARRWKNIVIFRGFVGTDTHMSMRDIYALLPAYFYSSSACAKVFPVNSNSCAAPY